MPSVLRTIAIEKKGIAEVVQVINRHREWLKLNGNWGMKERQRIQMDIINMLTDRLYERWLQHNTPELLQEKINQVVERKISPYQAVSELLG
jgi:putative protein kinase ArgK-like GTPase of G3E family